jgi:hypothetical protein
VEWESNKCGKPDDSLKSLLFALKNPQIGRAADFLSEIERSKETDVRLEDSESIRTFSNGRNRLSPTLSGAV